MGNLYYRLRKTKSIFDFNELENSEIYFASNKELNDPMEGYKNLIFNGDEIVWENFFKHYLRCLESSYQNYLIASETCFKDYCSEQIPVFIKVNEFPTTIYETLFNQIWDDAFNLYGSVIEKIINRSTPVTKEELSCYLQAFNIIALSVIHKHYQLNLIVPKTNEYNYDYTNVIESIKKRIDIHEENINRENFDKFVLLLTQVSAQSSDQLFLELKSNGNDKSKSKKLHLLNFTKYYLNAIEKLTYPDVYTASFMGRKAIHNSSVWGHYGDSHKGICLIFEADDSDCLSFSTSKLEYGSKRLVADNKKLEFKKIEYEQDYPEIDFFRTLGVLPTGQIISDWYTKDKDISTINYEVFDNENLWRDDYWNKFNSNNLIKMKDWEYEQEYRLILNSGMRSQKDMLDRKLKYDFNSLHGIIFGINTKEEDKLKIIDIIKKKCAQYERKEFKVYQAYHCNFKKNIQFYS